MGLFVHLWVSFHIYGSLFTFMGLSDEVSEFIRLFLHRQVFLDIYIRESHCDSLFSSLCLSDEACALGRHMSKM